MIHMNSDDDFDKISTIKSFGGGVRDGGDVDFTKCILLEKWEVDVVNKRYVFCVLFHFIYSKFQI